MEELVSDNDMRVSNQSEDEGNVSTVENSPATPGKASTGPGPETVRVLTDKEKTEIVELDEAIKKFESQKRWSDLIKAMIAKAELLVEPNDKIKLFSEAGRMYLEHSSNQVEAIKCFQRVLDYDKHNLEAITQLKDMYEKRRDWARLIEVMSAECDLIDPLDQPMRRVEIAQIATTRLRKPEVCIELWQRVLKSDETNAEAIEALSGLYERAREWGPLADVLEKRSEFITDQKDLASLLQKLGMIYSEKVLNADGAVRAFKRLLEIEPEDRRAQEQLKKHFVSMKAWDELEEFYSKNEKWDELIRTLEREADSPEASKDERVAMMFRVARLWQEKKDKADRAARSYEKVFTLDDKNLEAAEALSPIYEQAGDAKKLAGVYEIRLARVDDIDQRLALLRETALIYEEKLRNPQKAFEKYLEAFRTEPTRELPREDIARVAPIVKGWEQVYQAYSKAIEDSVNPDDVVQLRIHFGNVLSDTNRIDDAIAQYREIYEDNPTNETALAALDDLYRRTENYRNLLEIIQRRAELEVDQVQRKQLNYNIAKLWEEKLDDADQAIEAYRTIIIEYGDGERDAHNALDALYERQGRFEDFAHELEHRIDQGPESDEELAALRYRLARVLETKLDDKPRALDLYREVLMLMPEHDGARNALEGLLQDSALGGDAARILEPIYESLGEWKKLVDALEVLLKFTTDIERRLDLITKMGEVYADQLSDRPAALDVYCRALREVPDNPGIYARIQELASEVGNYSNLVKVLEELGKETPDAVTSRDLWIKAAQVYDLQLNNVDAAVDAYRKALDRDPEYEETLSVLEALFRRTERWRDLLDILRRRVDLASETGAKEELLAQMAFIQDEMLNAPGEAIRLFGEVLDMDPTNTFALTSLDLLFERQEMWSDLADNVRRQLSLIDDEKEQIPLMLKLGELHETRMNAVEAAIEIYRDVLDRNPINEAAINALERLIEMPAHQLFVAQILEPLYRDADNFQKLVKVHEIQVSHSESSDQRIALLHRMAELYAQALDDLGNSFKCYARAFAEDPTSSDTQEQLERIAEAGGEWQELVAVYEAQFERIDDPAISAPLHMKVAKIDEENLNNTNGAIEHYRKVLDLDKTQIEAANALERLYQLSERYEDLANIYLVKAELIDIPEEQKNYFFRAASIFEEILERPQDAIEVYNRLRKIEPDDITAIDKLIELYLRLEQWENVLEAYTHKADIVDDVDEKKRLYVEVGAVYERELQQIEKAIDSYQRILELDPDDIIAIGRLDALYQTTGNWNELLSVLEREADLADDPNEVISYRYRIGELWEKKLNDAERAVEVYRDILDVAPDHAPTLTALEAMMAEDRESKAVSLVLEPLYQSSEQHAKLVQALEVQIKYEEDPSSKLELLHRVASINEVNLGRKRDAFDAYARALPCDNQNQETLSALETLAEELSVWNEVASLYDREIETLGHESPDAMIEMALRLAQIFEVHVGDIESAIARYRIVYDEDSGNIQAIEALDRLYEATEKWHELAEILGKEIDVASSPDAILNLQFRLGQIYQIQLKDIDRAIGKYREILEADPDHSQAIAALEFLFADEIQPLVIGEIIEPLYRMQEAWGRLLGVQEVQLRYQANAEERVSMMHRMAEIAEEKANDPTTAFTWMQRALMEDPTHDHSLEECERLAAAVNSWAILANTYAGILEERRSSEALRTVGRRLVRIYIDELEDVPRAEETSRYIIGRDDTDDEVLMTLDAIYDECGAHEALAEVLRKRVAVTKDTLEKVDLSYRLAAVLNYDLGRVPEATTVYRTILDKYDSEHEGAIHALQDIYANQEDWRNLFDILEKEMNVAVGDTAQAEILARMASVASDKLHDLNRAIDLLHKVLDLIGEDPRTLNALGNIYAIQENWTDLVDVLEREVAVSNDDQMRIQIYSDLGRIWYTKLNRERNALESWERVLDIEPSHTGALFAIADVHRNAESFSDLIDTLHRIIDVGRVTLDDAVLEGIYLELGSLYSERQGQPADAVECYNHALEINPRCFKAMDALEEIHSREAQWEECIEVKERRAEALESKNEKIAVLLSIAKMWEEKLDDKNRGVGALNRILTIESLHEFAFNQLETLYRENERFSELVELYLMRVEASDDIEERIRLLRKVAKVSEEDISDRAQAFEALHVAWTQDYTNEETAAELERIAGLTQRWNEVLTAANEALQQLHEGDKKTTIAICIKCAKWYGREGHPEYAIPYLQQVLAIDPVNVAAMAEMADLYRQTGQWEIYSQVLSRMVEMTDDLFEKAAAFTKMGELNEKHLGLPEKAISRYLEALNAVPNHLDAITSLERMYRGREEWLKLIEILQKKLKAISDAAEMLDIRLQLAEVYEDRVDDKNKAIDFYKQVVAEETDNIQALKGLERLYTQTERWQDLLGILEEEYKVAITEKDQISLLMRIAGMWEEEFLKPDKAVDFLERVIGINPTHIESLQGLERLYRALQRWEDLIRTYERHIGATPERSEKVDLYHLIGRVYWEELNDTDRAVDAYLNVTSIDEDNIEALDALTKLYDKRGEYRDALDTLEKLSRLIKEPERLVNMFFQMGTLSTQQLGDRAFAVDYFQHAIDIDGKHIPSLKSLRDIYKEEGDWLAAARILEQAVEAEENSRNRAALDVELGEIYENKLEEHERAIECFEDAYRLDADNENAALPLVEEYMKETRWQEALPLLQMLVKRVASRSATDQHQLWFRLGQCAEHLDDSDTAIRAYTQAFELDSQDLASLMGLAAAYYRNQDWDKSFKYYQMVLVHHRDELVQEETTDTFYRLGVIKRQQGEIRKALNMFDKVLEEDSGHMPTLEALVSLYTDQKDFEQVIHFKNLILELTKEDPDRFVLFEEIGDIWKDKARNQVKAIESYVEALNLIPDSHKVLHKLLVLYQETNQWEPAVEIIERISNLDGRPEVKAKYAHTIALILRDELKNPDAAIEKFNEALDQDGTMLKAFESINKILTQKKDWKQLERAFRKMLHRVAGKGDEALEFNLWHNLGVIYRDRQKNLESAAEAYQMASRLQPDNLEEHQILAEIYGMIPGRIDEAIKENQKLLRFDPYRVESYRALYKLYFDARAYDKAWCLASTLNFLKKADLEQQKFYEQYRQRGPIRPKARLNNERWVKDVFHPEEDFLVGKVFEAITPAVLRIRGRSDKHWQLNKKQLILDVNTTTVTFARTFGFVTQVMNLPFTPRLFVCPDRQGGLAFAATHPPASVCGSALLSGLSPMDLMFIVARHLSYYRGEHYIRTMFQTKDEMKLILLAAMKISGVDLKDQAVDDWASQIQKNMEPADMELLNSVRQRFVEAGARTNIKGWMQAIELSACRAGLLMCNDLEIASRIIQNDPPAGAVDLSPKEKIKELVLFSVSEEYFNLREAIGIQIEIG
jgi:golgin subfamily B member 1